MGPSEVSSCLDLIGCVTETRRPELQFLPMDPNIQGSFLFNNSLNQFPTDLKAPVCQYSVPNSFYKLNPALNSQLQAGTPHGISDILSRSMVGMGTTGTTTLLSGYSAMGGFGPSVTSTSMYYNRDYNSNLGGFSKPGTECPMKGRSVSCWAESSCDWRGGRQQCSNSESELSTQTIDTSPTHHRLTASASASLLVTSECVFISTKRDKSKLITDDTK